MADFKLQKIQYSFAETVSAAGTLTLTSSSKMIQVITGTSAHTVQLPDATTVALGVPFIIQNNSTGVVTVQNNGAVVLGTLAAGAVGEFFPTNIGSANGVWRTYTSGSSSSSGLAAKGPDATVQAAVGLMAGDSLPSSVIQYINMSTEGNARNFGNLTSNRWNIAGLASTTRGVFGGGSSGPVNIMEYVSLNSTGSAIDFGDLTVSRFAAAAVSSSTRGLFGGGNNNASGLPAGYVNTIDYITIASVGNATDFGDLATARGNFGAVNSTTRGVWAGGINTSGSIVAPMDYVTIASAGNATSFGNLSVTRYDTGGSSNSTRGLFGGGNTGANSNVIDYITIATTGNAIDFGDLTVARHAIANGNIASSIRGLFAGGNNGTPSINYVEFATLSNAYNFGSLLTSALNQGACSNAHGGL